jgi:DNA (cytosine-5)-methyltransferase 1
MTSSTPLCFYEFFAGGGMARLGLGERWNCLFANDHDARKAKSYTRYFGDQDFNLGDIGALSSAMLPGTADLAWASFPCQDLSLTSKRHRLDGKRSGTFYKFWEIMQGLEWEGRPPGVIVIETVPGLVTSRRGEDLHALLKVLGEGGYNFGALEIDAERFVPQSRARIFLIAVREDKAIAPDLIRDTGPLAIPSPFHPPALRAAVEHLPDELAARWIWFQLPRPPVRTTQLMDLVEDPPIGVEWHRAPHTREMLDLMSPRHRARVDAAEASDEAKVGAFFRRTRSEKGIKKQRTEIRFDGLAGCLRAPAGGSSKQFLLFVKRNDVLSRPLSPRETARLMGLPEDYALPLSSAAALQLTGDGVAVPVVRWLSEKLLERLVGAGDHDAKNP